MNIIVGIFVFSSCLLSHTVCVAPLNLQKPSISIRYSHLFGLYSNEFLIYPMSCFTLDLVVRVFVCCLFFFCFYFILLFELIDVRQNISLLLSFFIGEHAFKSHQKFSSLFFYVIDATTHTYTRTFHVSFKQHKMSI